MSPPRPSLSLVALWTEHLACFAPWHPLCAQVGTVHSQRPAEDDNRTLKALNFMPGDYLDVALMAGF